MQNENSLLRYVGFMAFMLACAFFIRRLIGAMQEPALINAVTEYSVWLANNMVTLSYVAGVVLLIAALSVPLILMTRANREDSDIFVVVGAGVLGVSSIISIGYLAGMGWVAAELLLTQ